MIKKETKDLIKEIILEPLYAIHFTQLMSWYYSIPIRIDINTCHNRYNSNDEIIFVKECAEKLCKALRIPMPVIFLVGVNRMVDPIKEVIYRRKPIIRIHHNSDYVVTDLIRDFYLVYLWHAHREQYFESGSMKASIEEYADAEAYAFSLAFLEKAYPDMIWELGMTASEFVEHIESQHIMTDVLYQLYKIRDNFFNEDFYTEARA